MRSSARYNARLCDNLSGSLKTMNQFTLSDPAGRHLGFLVMMAEDEYDEAPAAGFAALRLSDEAPAGSGGDALLAQTAGQTLTWRLDGDTVCLFGEDGEPLGHIRQEWLLLGKSRFLLGDLTGVL